MKIVLELTKPQADVLREAVRYYAEEMSGYEGHGVVEDRVLEKVDAALSSQAA